MKTLSCVLYTGENFAFAGTFGDHMVLQRAPARARVWGYGFNVGDTVTVSLDGGAAIETTTADHRMLRMFIL